ncbi:MAG: arsenic efflux protein [Clostridia bacterium]|nr:arsenic efflux protein [Clostridia bacterium]
MEEILHILLHALIDVLKILPVLFLIYVFIEVIENKCAKNWKKQHFLNNKFSPLIASGVGIIPQCGFSVVATDLYSEKKIRMGTLLAIYIATSDEAIPILLTRSYELSVLKYLLLLVAIKFVFAIVVGYVVNFVQGRLSQKKVLVMATSKVEEIHDHDEHSEEEHSQSHDHDYGCCGHDVTEDTPTFKKFILHPLKHCLKITLFILIINFIFGILLHYVGTDNIQNFMMSTSIFQPFIVGLVGLIPNCASSVIITNLLLEGGITFASCVSGLCVNAGIALVVLFRTNKNIKSNILIVSLLYTLSVLLGFVLQFIV